ncbi:MAG: helix-turn-helix domain-containing protein [Dysgonomonas sp.]
MDELKQIGLRLKGLRDSLDINKEDFAVSCNIPIDEYDEYEAGKRDFSISMLKHIADKYEVDLTTLMFDDEPRMKSYFITRKEKGLAIKRVEDYQYEALAAGFNSRKADIFVVTVEPKPEIHKIHKSSHTGHEFNLVLEGKMLFHLNGKDIVLNEGDSIYFDSCLPHGMKALDGKRVKFLAIVF